MERLLSLKVLLIEDNPSDVLLLRTALEADPLSGFALTHVERLADGLKQLEEGTFDIVLADLGLPDSSGLDTFERLHRQAPDMPVIVFSGNEDEEQAIHAVRDGAQDYLVKNMNGFDMAARSIRYAIERNKLQSTLRESEQRFTTLFRMNPVPVGITHASDYSILDVNDAWTSLTGYTRDEALGKTSTGLGLARPETLMQIRGKLGDQGAIHQFDIPLHTRAGQERRVLISSERIELGGEVYFFNSLLDITERKQAEDALAKSEERHRLISGLTSDYVYNGTLYADGTAKTNWISGAFEQITGYTLDEINKTKNGFTSIVLPDDLANMLGQQAQFIKEGSQTTEYRIRKKDGTICWLRDYHQISSIDPDTNDLDIIGAVQDITEQKQADEKLRASEERYRNLIENMNEVVMEVDEHGNFCFISPNYAKLSGYSSELELNTSAFAHVHPDDIPLLLQTLENDSLGTDQSIAYRVQAQNGDWHWIEASGHSYQTETGEKRTISVARDVTERKLAEEALKESEERFSKAFFTSPLSQSIISTQTGEVVEVNDACCHLYEYSREELIGVDPGKLNLWANPADEASVLEELQRTGHLLPREITIRVKSGEIRTIIFSTEPITWNRILCLISSSIDITERKQTEEKLRDSEKKYRELINGMNDTVWVIDFDTTILDVNEAASAVLGYTREELLSMKVPDIDLSMKPEQIQHLASAMTVDKSQIFEGVHSTRDGRQIPVEISSTLVTYQGRTVIMSIARDITERKHAEEAVRASEERLRKILQTTSDGFWLVDSNRRFLDVNEAYCAMSGYAREELLSMTISDVEAVEAVSDTNDRIHGIMNEGRDLFEARHRRKDGTLFDVEVSINMLGQGTGLMVCLCRDITERKKVAQTLQESQERYKQFINQSFEAISRTEFDQPVDTSMPVEEQIDQIYANAYMAECNQAMAEMYKTPLEQFIGTRLVDAHGGKDNPTNRAAFRKFILNGYKSIDDETIEYDAQGNQHWFLSNTVGTVEDGKLIRLWGTAIEVTDRKKAEAALRESNERFQQIAATIQEVFWIYDNHEQSLLYVSPGLENLWGRPIPTLDEVNRLTMESIYPEDRPLHLELLAKQQQGQPTDGEYRIVNADGKVRWVHSRSFPLLDENGTLVRTTGIIADVTSRKQAVQDALYRQELLEKVILLGKKIAAITDLESCLREIYEGARFELGFDRIGLFLYDGSVRHVTGVYGTTRTGEMESPGFIEGSIDEFEDWTTALQSPVGISWHDQFERDLALAEDHVMHGVKQHLTVAAWAGEKPVALITADNLLTGREITAPDIEALQLFAGYVGLAIENASLHGELELKVEERTAEVQDLYDNAPTGYHSLDANGYFIQINQTELSWLGYTREEVIGHLIGEFITENSRAIFQQNFPRFKKEGRLRDLELEMVRKDGSVFPVLVNATAILDGRGNFIMSRTTVFDHSERKTAEQALRDSQANLQNFLDTASDMIQSLDEHGNFIYVNDAWCESLGYTQQEAVRLTMFDVVDPAYHEHCRATLRELVTSGHPQQLEIIFRTKTGETIVAEGSVSGRMVKGGELVTNGIFRNITKRKQAEASLQRANLELERALRMKDEFLASMSHELRTPLTGILGLSEALQYDTYGELNPKQKTILSNIENNGRHLLDLITDILDISKMEAGKLELEMYPCALSEVCQSSLQLVKGMAQKKGQQVAFSMNPTDIVVKGDPRRLKQILVNLLSNAVKYSPGNSSIGLDVQADTTNQVVTLEVWDNGMGIPPEDLDRLFQPFVQLDSSLSRQQTGTGLGLALVQKLVDLHGGSIQVESTPGMGSRFIVKLPSLSSTVESKQETEELSPLIHNALIVEDRATDSGRLTRSLKMLGIYSTVLTTGAGVQEEAARLQPGVILLDLDLPEVSGWEVLEHLKHNDLTRDIPVVITSVVDERERAAQLGAAGYLVKFFTLDELRSTLSHLPQAGRTRQEKGMGTSPAVPFGTIMIVDDNETNIMMLDDFLQSKNYNVATSLSGIDFLNRVPDIQPDLVLMDIQMPDMDGLETIRRLRLLPEPRLARVPVIAITALAMPGDRERCLEAGANEYISKPIRLKELVSVIQAMMISRVDADE